MFILHPEGSREKRTNVNPVTEFSLIAVTHSQPHCTAHPAAPPPAVSVFVLLYSHLRAFVTPCPLLEVVFILEIFWFIVPGC